MPDILHEVTIAAKPEKDQAMLPLLREAPAAHIVNVSSGVGSLTRNTDPAYAYRSTFGPVYPASKTALNAMTLAMAIELEGKD
jgi:NAD(P)-dependent dehydrogenase (short-subunit alcohol dehydrogenase family)